MTLSPTATSSGTRLPWSSMRPGPIAWTSPAWGFSLAVSGMTRPKAVVCSASSGLTTIRSSRGLMLTDTVSTSTFSAAESGLAHSPGECQHETSTLVNGVPAWVPGRVAVDVESVQWLRSEDGQRVLAVAGELDEPDPLRAHDALERAC